MKEFYDSYYDYDFSCKTDLSEKAENNCRELVKSFNGGGSGG